MTTSVLIIGAGNMGGALAKGLARDPSRWQVSIYDIHADRSAALRENASIAAVTELGQFAFAGAIVVLAVKPQDLRALGKQLEPHLEPSGCVISILAGITTDDIAKACCYDGPIIRAMPNIAALVGEAATAMAQNKACAQSQTEVAEAIFASVGTAVWVKEAQMDAVTGLSGSGPAYLYMIIEALTDGGVKMGLPAPVASQLAMQTVLGAARHVIETGLHPAILREQVTTPGGTTINAIHELEDHGLRAMLMSAVETATKRSAKLRKKR